MRFETNTIKDLPDIERMGHTCVNLNGDLFFIWGGSNEDTSITASRNTHLWIYETLTGYWRHRTCSGDCPPYLSGSTSSLIGQKMYVFGGHSTIQDNWLNNIYCLNLENFTWKDLQRDSKLLKFEPTKPIKSDKCVSWTHDNKLYVFGGYGWSQIEHLLQILDLQKDLQLTPDYRWPKFGWNNQLVEFNPQNNTWRWPSYSGKCPSARAAHAGAIMGDLFYLFGGRDSKERLNDLYTLNMRTLEWQQITTFADPADVFVDSPLRRRVSIVDHSNNHSHYDDQNLIDHLEDDIMHDQDQEHLTPSPSSSAQMRPDFAEPEEDAEDDDDDEEEDEDFEYPHPSHLLERWSLSSNQSASCSSNRNFDSFNCTQSQNNTTNEPNNCVLGIGSSQQSQNGLVRSATVMQQQRQDQSVDNLQLNELQQQLAPNSANNLNESVHHSNDYLESNSPGHVTTEVKSVPMPIGRSFASFTPISSENILLYGGISSQDENLSDCWVYNIKFKTWTLIDLKTTRYPRLWHSGACTKNNEVIVIGGSSSDKIDDFCTDVLTISLEPKSLKQLSLDCVARSLRMRTVNKIPRLPSTVYKLVKLRKQALALTTIRRTNNNNRLPLNNRFE